MGYRSRISLACLVIIICGCATELVFRDDFNSDVVGKEPREEPQFDPMLKKCVFGHIGHRIRFGAVQPLGPGSVAEKTLWCPTAG